MDIEAFVRQHPIGYVHIAYSVVWGIHFGYALWIAARMHRTPPA